MNQHDHTPIDDLLIKYLLRETTPEEARSIEEWLAEDDNNDHYCQQLRLLWEKSIHISPATLKDTDSLITRISVESGRIRVANTSSAIELSAGESITLTPNDHQLQIHPTPATVHTHYHPKVFICNSTPLIQLTEALQNAYNVPIVIADTTLKNQPIAEPYQY